MTADPMTTPRFTEAEAKARMEFATAALAVAGHEITDPFSLELLEKHARGEISGDEARAAMRRYVQG